MKKYIERIKANTLDESKKTGLVVLGFMTGAALSVGFKKLGEKFPKAESFLKYAKPVVISGGGIIIAAATEKESSAKYFGYGLATEGAFEGVKLIPVAKEMLSGIGLGESSGNYYTENGPTIELNGFGLNALPVGQIQIEEPAPTELSLPNLDARSVGKANLGYNASATDSADETENFNGII